MSERKGFKPMLASLMAAASGYMQADPLSLPASAGRLPRQGRNKTRRAHARKRWSRNKPFFSMGYRGLPRTNQELGRIPAPSLDQVRFMEREYKCRLQVKHGLMYFKGENVLFDVAKASQRLAEREHAAIA